jgi:Sigma-70 region 2
MKGDTDVLSIYRGLLLVVRGSVERTPSLDRLGSSRGAEAPLLHRIRSVLTRSRATPRRRHEARPARAGGPSPEGVTAFAARRCSCAEDVADVVAQTFVRLLEVADRSDPTRGDPGPFVFGIAVNAARDLHRRGSRQRAIASKLVGTSWQACVSPGPSPPGPTTATPMARATGGTNQRNGSRPGWRPILLSCLGVTWGTWATRRVRAGTQAGPAGARLTAVARVVAPRRGAGSEGRQLSSAPVRGQAGHASHNDRLIAAMHIAHTRRSVTAGSADAHVLDRCG